MNVAEAVEGELGMVLFLPVPLAGIVQLLLRKAQVRGVDIALRVQGLKALQCIGMPRIAADSEFRPAGEVLPEVHHALAPGRYEDALRRELLPAAHAAARLSTEHAAIAVHDGDGPPVLRHALRRAPALALQPRIVAFAVVDFEEGHGAVPANPALVAQHELLPAVRVADQDLAEEGGLIAVVVAQGQKAHQGLINLLSHSEHRVQ